MSKVPSYSELEALRKKATPLTIVFYLEQPTSVLWPHLSNTDLMNESLGLAEPEYHWEVDDEDYPHMFAVTKNAGVKTYYYECPYQWIENQFLSVERIYEKGLFEYLKYGFELQAKGDKTEVTVTFNMASKLPSLPLKLALKKTLKSIQSIFEGVAKNLTVHNYRSPAAGYFSNQSDKEDVDALNERLLLLYPGSEMLTRTLAQYIHGAPERYVQHLRPNEVAAYFNLPSQMFLSLCLLAAKAGELTLRWAMLCTSCWGPKNEAQSMAFVEQDNYCESCAYHYGTTLNENLELVFAPTAKVRPTHAKFFCAGSPSNTTHVQSQRLLWPGQDVSFELPQAEGQYTIWLNKKQIPFTIDSEGSSQNGLAPDTAFLPGNEIKVQVNTLTLLRLERPRSRAAHVTAAQAYANQEFLEMFADQLPAPDTFFNSSSQVFLSTHIAIDDEEPLIQSEIQDLLNQISRDSQGAPVQTPNHGFNNTVFHNLTDALSSAQKLFKQFTELQLLYNDIPIGLNVFLHIAPCQVFSENKELCLNLNALDSAIEQCQNESSHLFISDDCFIDEGVQAWLMSQDLQLMPSQSEVEPWLHLKPLPVGALV